MKDDRTVRSEQFWDEDLERSGGKVRPFCVSGPDELLLQAIDCAVSAGACRVAGRANPQCQATWNAVAQCKSRDAARHLADWLIARRAKG